MRLSKHATLPALGALAALAAATAAHAGGLLMTAQNVTTPSGGTGMFDVILTDEDIVGASAYQISGFSFEVSVPSGAGITFTNADTITGTANPYIFGTYQSGPAPFSYSTFPSTDVIASDADFTGPDYVTAIGPGQSYGLGHVTYAVSPGTLTGPVTISLGGIGTSLSDIGGNDIPFSTAPGTLTVSPSVAGAPEPSEWAALGFTALSIGGLLLRARRRLTAASRD